MAIPISIMYTTGKRKLYIKTQCHRDISSTRPTGDATVRGQNFSSDALFTPKMDIFKQTILNTAYIKTLEIFLSARESLSIQTSISRSVSNQSRLHGS